MAYGNYGAFVYRNGERMTQWEDQTPYKEKEWESGYSQAFGKPEGADPFHAVLGGQRVRLCGYKEIPNLFLDGEKVGITPFCYDPEEINGHWGGEIEGYVWSAIGCNGNFIALFLREPDGTVWTATCGYGYGAGHE